MATYAVGDVQGCYDSLMALMSRIGFDPRADRLWLAGDLVNRGPRSLEVLRWVRSLGHRAVCVLGNHDLHLVARRAGIAPEKPRDRLDEVLAAPDSEELCDWLRTRPLIHVDGEHALVHAGLWPSWSIADACALAAEVEAALADDDWIHRIGAAGGGGPSYSASLKGEARLRAVLSVMIRIRTVTIAEPVQMNGQFSGPVNETPEGFVPWFDHPARRSRAICVVFGHWAALGALVRDDIIALDSGCVWGRELTAVRLEDQQVFSQPAID
ncbi:MAG TPA: symmetrical bis(5'-nucleosyl)-tetraphosphatase [Kofleriaceae bacterium]|nr:symmetrical bis(5'-nucleosyl)-tetraphosphatase [Kofleriaceae bacterium]